MGKKNQPGCPCCATAAIHVQAIGACGDGLVGVPFSLYDGATLISTQSPTYGAQILAWTGLVALRSYTLRIPPMVRYDTSDHALIAHVPNATGPPSIANISIPPAAGFTCDLRPSSNPARCRVPVSRTIRVTDNYGSDILVFDPAPGPGVATAWYGGSGPYPGGPGGVPFNVYRSLGLDAYSAYRAPTTPAEGPTYHALSFACPVDGNSGPVPMGTYGPDIFGFGTSTIEETF